MFIPVRRMNTKSLLFAGRNKDEASFREADQEMFLILSSQAAIALENSRLFNQSMSQQNELQLVNEIGQLA